MNKKKLLRIIGAVFLFTALAAVIYYGYKYYKIAMIAAGYQSKIMCSEIFVGGRESGNVIKTELSNPLLEYFSWAADYDEMMVESSFMGLFGQETYYKEGFGGIRELDPVSGFFDKAPDSLSQTPVPKDMPVFSRFPENIDSVKLHQIVSDAFTEDDSSPVKNTRALIIVYKDTLLIEKYAENYDRSSRILGWSMTKSVINAWIGILAGKEIINVYDPVPIKEWQEEDDKRKNITWDNLLRMQSGLEFSEDYDDLDSDVLSMLFYEEDICDYPVNKELKYPPGEYWKYSSGTTNIITRALRNLYGSYREYWEFPYKEIFEKAGIRTAVIEPDAEGYFVGSSFMYAAPLDWARFGMIYLNKGNINGETIFPESWVEYTTTRTENSENQKYGAHFWLAPLNEDGTTGNLPSDYFYAAGHNGQFVSILPSSDMVIVRMGYTENSAAWNQDAFIYSILQTMKH